MSSTTKSPAKVSARSLSTSYMQNVFDSVFFNLRQTDKFRILYELIANKLQTLPLTVLASAISSATSSFCT